MARFLAERGRLLGGARINGRLYDLAWYPGLLAAATGTGAWLMGRTGRSGLTHRAVATRAGLPLSTTSYFFDSLDDLLLEALRVFSGRRAAFGQPRGTGSVTGRRPSATSAASRRTCR